MGKIKAALGFVKGLIDIQGRVMGVAFCLIGIFSLFDLPGDALGSLLLTLFGLYRVFGIGKS